MGKSTPRGLHLYSPPGSSQAPLNQHDEADSESARLKTFLFPTNLFVADVFHKEKFLGMTMFAMHDCSEFTIAFEGSWEPSIVSGPL